MYNSYGVAYYYAKNQELLAVMQTTINNSLNNKKKSSRITDEQKAAYTALQSNLANMIQMSFVNKNTNQLKATYRNYINGYYFTKADGYFDKIATIQAQQDAYKLNYD